MPYAGIKESTQEIGLVIVIKITMLKQSFALSASIPPSMVIGFVSARTMRQLAIMTISANQESFFI